MFNTLLSYPSLVLSAKIEDGKFASKFFVAAVTKTTETLHGTEIAEKNHLRHEQLNYQQSPFLKFHKIDGQKEVVVKSLDSHTLKSLLRNI